MEFSKKYRHVGYSYVGLGKGWNPIVEKAVIEIEKAMWSQWWLPLFVKRLIHFLATDNSVVRVKFGWAYRLRQKLTGGQMITDIKDKYATLRIYAYSGKEMNEIIKRVTKECSETCESCGSKDDVQYTDTHWVYNYCAGCRNKMDKA